MITIDRLSLPGDWRPKPGDLLRIKSISGSVKSGRWTFKMELVTDESRLVEVRRDTANEIFDFFTWGYRTTQDGMAVYVVSAKERQELRARLLKGGKT